MGDPEDKTRRSSVFGEQKKGETFCNKLKSVISNKVWLALMLSLTGLFYVVTGIQYWLSIYL